MSELIKHQELALCRSPDSVTIPIELVRKQQTAGAAISLACQSSGLEDKEIYLACGIDAGTFSRIKKNEATLQAEKISAFCQTVGNTIYSEWLAFQVVCNLVMIKSEAERQRDAERDRAEKAEAQVELLKGLLIGRAA